MDVLGSPGKMVVLSAKSNEMLAHLFKMSANYLTKSPTKRTAGQAEKKKMNEDLSVLSND